MGSLTLDRAQDECRERQLAISGHPGDRRDARRCQRRLAVHTARPRGQIELARSDVGVELAREDPRRVAQTRVA